MIKNRIARNALFLVLVTVLLCAFVPYLSYLRQWQKTVMVKEEEALFSRGELAARITHGYLSGDYDYPAFHRILGGSADGWDAELFITDSRGEILFATDQQETDRVAEALLRELAAPIALVRGNLTRYSSDDFPEDSVLSGDLVVAVPVLNDARDAAEAVAVLYKPISEITRSLTHQGYQLPALLLIVLTAVVPLAIFLSLRYTRHVSEMRQVTSRMADGDFTLRAHVRGQDELSSLAQEINRIADQLGAALSDLTIEKNRLYQTLDGLQEGLVAVDGRLQVTHFNHAVLEMFHLDERAGAVPGQIQLPNPEIWSAFRKVLREGETFVSRVPFEESIVMLTVSPLHNRRGKTVGAVGLFTDITAAEQLEQTRRDYVANVSHELRTPLTSMRGLLEPLTEGLVQNEADRQRYLQIILRETLRMNRLVSDLLELSRLQTGSAVSMQRFAIDPATAIENAFEQIAPVAFRKNIRLVNDCEDRPLPTVYFNPDRLEQIMVIFMDNAVKYTPEGGRVRVGAEQTEDCLAITVSDTGIGISAEDLPHLFDRFYKVNKARGTVGSGLGLAIAKEVLDRFGESVSVESREGKGTAFTFTLHYPKSDKKKPRRE